MKKSKLIVLLVMFLLILSLNASMQSTYAISFYDTLGTKYEGAVERLAELEIVNGTSEGVFSPNKKVTRAEFAKMLVESSLTPAEQAALEFDYANVIKFKDLDAKEWYYKYITIAVNKNYMKGYADDTFKPNKEVTYSEIAKMITLALGHEYLVETDPRGWDAEYIDKAWEENLFDYVDFNSPSEQATRGNVANIIWNMLKAHEWQMIYRNDTSGFSYVDSGHRLIDSKVIDHAVLIGAVVNGYREINGEVWIQLNGGYYRIFNQKAEVNFSSIGGTTDVLLKRVEYPGKEIRYEAIGISTDIGSQLYAGTYAELTKDGFKLINRKKLSPDADYAFLYHYENDPEQDRNISINLSNTYVIDKIDIKDTTISAEVAYEDEKDTSHSSVENQFIDDTIAYRYTVERKEFTRDITINEGEAFIENTGALIFKDNKRVEWNSVQKDDVVVEVTPGRYYFVQTGNDREVKLLGYSNNEKEYYIETSKGKFETYKTTLYSDYFTNDVSYFNKKKKEELDAIVGRNVQITQDISDRVVRIVLLEDDITFDDLNMGFVESISPQDNKTALLKILQDGKSRTLYSTTDNIRADKGNLIQYEFEKGSKKNIKSIKIIAGSAKITDKIKMDAIKLEDLVSKLEYFDDEELDIYKVTYHYNFAKYKNVTSADVENITIEDVKDLPAHEDIKISVMLDNSGVMKKVFVFDDREKNGTFYGLVLKLYKKSSDKKNYAQLLVVGKEQPIDYLVNNIHDSQVGDFVNFDLDGTSNITIGEKFSTSGLGYSKDLIVKSANLEKNKVVSYNLNGGGIIDMVDWTISTTEEEYRLRNYEVFILDVSLDNHGMWTIDKATRTVQSKAEFKPGDRIAINEIEGTAIVYRGYTE